MFLLVSLIIGKLHCTGMYYTVQTWYDSYYFTSPSSASETRKQNWDWISYCTADDFYPNKHSCETATCGKLHQWLFLLTGWYGCIPPWEYVSVLLLHSSWVRNLYILFKLWSKISPITTLSLDLTLSNEPVINFNKCRSKFRVNIFPQGENKTENESRRNSWMLSSQGILLQHNR